MSRTSILKDLERRTRGQSGEAMLDKAMGRPSPHPKGKRMHPKDWHARQRQETVSVTFRFVTKSGQAIAVADGTEEPNPETGELREKLYFLPLIAISIADVDMSDRDALNDLKGKTIVVSAPERMLLEKGLL